MIKLKDTHFSIEEIESLLNFTYLPSLSFRDEEEKAMIRGLGNLKSVDPLAKQLGEKFSSHIASSYIAQVSIKHVNEEVGYGLFLEEDLSENAYLGEYTGIVRVNSRRYLEPLNNYCYRYPVEENLIIDATCGHLTRFINHSYNPNLEPLYAFIDGFYHLIFLTRTPLKKGTQLSYDYGKNYWYLRGSPHFI